MRPHRKVEIQVPAPETRAVHDESRKIQKPPRSAVGKPVIIYMVSPKVIHVEASEFMSLVQRLTGPEGASGASTSRGHGDGGGEVGRTLPVKVKASRALRGSGSLDHQQYPSISSTQEIGDISPTLYFHDLSPPACSVRNDGAMESSPTSWLLHGDYLDQSPRHQSESALVSSSSFLDMLSQLPAS